MKILLLSFGYVKFKEIPIIFHTMFPLKLVRTFQFNAIIFISLSALTIILMNCTTIRFIPI